MNAMNKATTDELQRLSNLEVLSHYTPETLLEAFLHAHNQQTQEWNALVEENQALTLKVAELEPEAACAKDYANQIVEMEKEIGELQEENEFCKSMALKAEKIANQSLGLQRERDQLKQQVSALQRQLTELKGGDNPQKLKERIARLTEKSKEREKRITQLEKGRQEDRRALEKSRVDMNNAIAKIAKLQKQLAHDTGSGLYHNKEHHLIIWPQKTKMQDDEGNIFEGRSLLYLHRSGRGGLITYNPNTGEANLCAAPKNGLRPSEETCDFAKNWLFKVNVLQQGVVNEEDMKPVNYNGDNFQ
ncbi:hypothetical protein QTU67_003401 [Vibrio cholerae]|nr:hypothetical protein [Vibrio cholerae]